jgi:hypothetical protein
MSVGQLPYPEQIQFPPVDVDQVTPSVDDVALLCATRTIDTTGAQLSTFTSDTRPTDAQAGALIAQATTMVLAPLPDHLQESLYVRIRQAVALQAALLVETSFYREQANTGTVVAMSNALQAMLRAIQEDAGGAGISQRVDSIVVRATYAEYDPYYQMPPPPVVGGGAAQWAPPAAPTGPPQVASINPTGFSVANAQNVIVSASGVNFAVTADLVAVLEDHAGTKIQTSNIADPSGQGTMLVATFPPPPTPAPALGAGWFYLLKAGASYGALTPWEWMA